MVLLLLLPLLIAAGLLIAYLLSPASGARKRAKSAVTKLEILDGNIRTQEQHVRQTVSEVAGNYVQEVRSGRLRTIPVDGLRHHASGLRLQALKEAGLWSLADLQGWSADRLAQLRGVGPKSAAAMAYVVGTLTNQSNALPIPHPIPPSEQGRERPLVQAICLLGWFQSWLPEKHKQLLAIIQEFRARRDRVTARTSFARWLWGFGSHPDIQNGIVEAGALARELEGNSPAAQLCSELSDILSRVRTLCSNGIEWGLIAKDFAVNQAHYVRVMTEHLGTAGAIDHPAVTGASEPVAVRMATAPSPPAAYIPTPPSPHGTQRKAQSSGSLWLPPGRDVTVAGFMIRGGMVYVGSDLVSVRGGGREPALIDPAQSVAQSAADCHARYTNYWPSYNSITPEARASYLQWLATGKCDPQADIGYVFLYFYGLERRALLDATHDPQAKAELPAIEQEVRRLLPIYGSSASFHGYAGSFLDYLVVKEEGSVLEGLSPPPQNRWGELSLELRVGLGLYARAGRPLPAAWAVAWYFSAPGLRRGHAAFRCSDAFVSLFKAEFGKRFGEGMKLPVNKTRIKVTHRAASLSFGGVSFTAEQDLPDVSVLSGPVAKLQEIGDACCALLAPYSRFLGANPGKADSLDALLLLPVCLWPEPVCKPLRELRQTVLDAGQAKLMPMRDLHALLPSGDSLNKGRFGALSRTLGGLGLGIEPDVRFGGHLPGPEEIIALFVADHQDQDRPVSESFSSAALMLHMAAVVASANSGFDESAASVMLDSVNGELDIPEIERRRLAARLSLYRSSPPSSAGLKGRIESLDKAARETISGFLLQVALAHGVVDPGQVRVLENLYKLLGLDQSSLYSKLHKLEAQHIPASSVLGTHIPTPISSASTAGTAAIRLDPMKIATLKADSAKISVLLGNVFVAGSAAELEEPPIENHDKKAEPSLLDLDTAHAALLNVLLQRTQWSRAELEEVCADRGLMVDGAIERINEVAFNRFDHALIEGEDPIDINRDLALEERV